MEYRLLIELDVLHFVLSRPVAERRFLIRMFEVLASDPYRRGDLHERTADGQMAQVLVIGKYLITYWADHAVKELRIIRTEII